MKIRFRRALGEFIRYRNVSIDIDTTTAGWFTAIGARDGAAITVSTTKKEALWPYHVCERSTSVLTCVLSGGAWYMAPDGESSGLVYACRSKLLKFFGRIPRRLYVSVGS